MLFMVLYIKMTKCLFGGFCFYKWKGNTAKIDFQYCCAFIFPTCKNLASETEIHNENENIYWK